MGHKHSKDEILAGALEAAYADGFKQLTFGRVAKHLGINDRTVVYYFPTKNDLVGAVMMAMGMQLEAALSPTLTTPAANHLELARSVWPSLATPEADATLALFFEANGLAATGNEPYKSLVPVLVEAWISWTEAHIHPNTADNRAEAEAAVALLDGLLLMRQLVGARAANRAAKRLGVLD